MIAWNARTKLGRCTSDQCHHPSCRVSVEGVAIEANAAAAVAAAGNTSRMAETDHNYPPQRPHDQVLSLACPAGREKKEKEGKRNERYEKKKKKKKKRRKK